MRKMKEENSNRQHWV